MNENDRMTAEEYQEYVRSGRMPERMMQPKESKYHNKKTVIDGKKFDSKKEGNYYAELRMMEQAKEVTRFLNKYRLIYRAGSYISLISWCCGRMVIIR